MKLLEGILEGAWRRYLREKTVLERKLRRLPAGTVKKRVIYGNVYYYLQYRQGDRIIHHYLGKSVSPDLLRTIQQRKIVRKDLSRMREALDALHRFRAMASRKERRKKGGSKRYH